MNKQSLQRVFRDPKSYTTTLYYCSAIAAGHDASIFELDPETVILELSDSLAMEIPEVNRAKVLAAQTLTTTDLIYRDLPAFIRFCNLASSEEAPPDQFDPADAYEISWGLWEISSIDNSNDLLKSGDKTAFSQEIRKYIGVMCQQEGLRKPVESMDMAILPPIDLPADEGFVRMAFERHEEVEHSIAQHLRKNQDQLSRELDLVLRANQISVAD